MYHESLCINIAAGKDRAERLKRVEKYQEVKNAYILFGEWDIVAEIEVANPEELGTFVINNIRSRSDVRLTSSLIVAAK